MRRTLKGKGKEAGCQKRGINLGFVQVMASPFSRVEERRAQWRQTLWGRADSAGSLSFEEEWASVKVQPQC